MKIMIITAMFPPIQTGSSFYAQDIAQSLKARGHKIVLVTLRNDKKTEQDGGYSFPIHRLPAIHFRFLLNKYFKHFRVCSIHLNNYRRIHKLIRENGIEFIFLVSHYHDISFPAVLLSRWEKIPLICSIHTQLQLLNPTGAKLIRMLDRLICGKLIIPYCHMIISLDCEIRRYLQETYNHSAVAKSVVIPYGHHGELRPDCFDHRYEFHGQMIGVGALIEQRNFIFSILLFKNLLEEFPDLRFKIVGHIYYSETVKLVEELGLRGKVIFTGELPHDEVLQEMKKSDIYMGIFSGKYVGLGTATIESMLLGVPVVANIPSDLFEEIRLRDMEEYVFADTGRAEEVRQKVTDLLKNGTLREKIGKNGQNFVRTHLNWEHIAEKIEKSLKGLTLTDSRRTGILGKDNEK